MSELKTFKDLQKWTGYTQASKVKECLEFKSEMAKLKRLMGAEYWTAHELKSKGLTDSKDKNMAGLTEAMKKRYIKFNTHEAVE